MAEEQLFRSAIGGFNKEDVIEYIDGINRAAAENQDWFDRQSKAMAETIKRLTQENNSLKSAATSNAQEVSRLQEELRRLQDEAQAGGHSDQEVADLKRQLAEQSEALEESERRFNAVCLLYTSAACRATPSSSGQLPPLPTSPRGFSAHRDRDFALESRVRSPMPLDMP